MGKILFLHNSLPEYRIVFMEKLSTLTEVIYLITDESKAEKVYGFSGEKSNVGFKYIIPDVKGYNNIVHFLENIIINQQIESIVLPPVDDLLQIIWCKACIKVSKKYALRSYYWTEKWEPSSTLQPFIKKIKNSFQRKLINYFAKNCTLCIAAGTRQQIYLESLNIKRDKIRIAYDSSTSQTDTKIEIKNEYGIAQNMKIILYFGRIIERKGLVKLLLSYKTIKKEMPDTCLIVAGEGDDYYLNKCEEIVKKLQLSDIFFVGKVSPKIRKNYFESSDVFVLPSYTYKGVIEAWGLTVNESLECGTPVVSTTAVGAAYDLLNGKNGIMVEENDVQSLTNGIIKILKSNRKDIERNCKETYSRFSVNNMAEEFCTILNEN